MQRKKSAQELEIEAGEKFAKFYNEIPDPTNVSVSLAIKAYEDIKKAASAARKSKCMYVNSGRREKKALG